ADCTTEQAAQKPPLDRAFLLALAAPGRWCRCLELFRGARIGNRLFVPTAGQGVVDAQLCDQAGGGPGNETQLLAPYWHIGAVPTDAQAFLPVGQIGLAPVGGVVVAVAGGAVERVLPVVLAHADPVLRVRHLPQPDQVFRALGV